MHLHGFLCNVKIHRLSLLLIDIGFMDLSSVHGNKLQMRFSHHYKSVDVRVQINEMFLFFPILRRKFLFFSYFSAFSFLFSYFLQVIWHLTPCSVVSTLCCSHWSAFFTSQNNNVIQHNLKLNYSIKTNHSLVKERMGRNP